MKSWPFFVNLRLIFFIYLIGQKKSDLSDDFFRRWRKFGPAKIKDHLLYLFKREVIYFLSTRVQEFTVLFLVKFEIEKTKTKFFP